MTTENKLPASASVCTQDTDDFSDRDSFPGCGNFHFKYDIQVIVIITLFNSKQNINNHTRFEKLVEHPVFMTWWKQNLYFRVRNILF
jgi:hypothetical protein